MRYIGEFKYAMIIVDDFSSTIFAYFLKLKSDATKAFEKFLADSAPHGTVKQLRSDNGGEFISGEFEQLLVKNKIAFQSSAPYSPHQNGTAERGWRSIFDMARCLLIESKLPETLWTYAVMAAVYIRNRCFNQRIEQTPVFKLTGKAPNVSKLHVFGSVCYAYTEIKTKLEPRAKKGVFLGYDQYSPAYLVYDRQTRKVSKHRCVKFTEKYEHEPTKTVKPAKPSVGFKPPVDNTYHYYSDDDYPGAYPAPAVQPNADVDVGNNQNNIQNNLQNNENNDEEPIVVDEDVEEQLPPLPELEDTDRYPRRQHNPCENVDDDVMTF